MNDKVFTEKDLIIPALLQIYYFTDLGGLNTSGIIDLLREELSPKGDDLSILQCRNDDKFSQKVRNLVSHKTIEKFVRLEAGRFFINKEGIAYLKKKGRIAEGGDDFSSNIGSDDFRDQNDGYVAERNADVENLYLSVSDLKRRYDRSKVSNTSILILDATFQREGNIWSGKTKSLLIESVLLNIPIPSIYLSEDFNGNFVVIDGRQRLSTLFDFMDDKFRLTGLSIMKGVNKKKFSDLTGDFEKFRAKIEDKSLHIAKIKFGTDETFVVETFERVNTRGARLNAQEIRNALHQGKSTILLNSISSKFDRKEKIVDKKRMKDKYLVLRYFAMNRYYEDLVAGKKIVFKSITNYLADTMELLNDFENDDIVAIENDFISVYKLAVEVFGEASAFRLKDKLPVNMILFEITLLITKLCRNSEAKDIKLALEKFINSDSNPNSDDETPFEKNIRYHRDSRENIEQRLNWVNKVVEEQ